MRPLLSTAPVLALMLAATALSPLAASAEDAPREAVIIVSGEGEAAVAPDMAVVTMAVVREADSAAEAMTDSNAAMAAVLAELKAQGIADKDIQTTDFAVTPQYSYQKTSDGGTAAPDIDGYQVTNRITVRLRDLDKLGALLDTSVKLGVNEGGNIRFTNDEPAAAIAEARTAAVKDAMAKAKALTEAAGVGIGRIVEISENFARPMPQPMFRAAMVKEMSDASVPVASGENTYTVTVNITYAIAQ